MVSGCHIKNVGIPVTERDKIIEWSNDMKWQADSKLDGSNPPPKSVKYFCLKNFYVV